MRRRVCPAPRAFLLLGVPRRGRKSYLSTFFSEFEKPAPSAFVKVMFPPIFRFRENPAQMGLPHTKGIPAAGGPSKGSQVLSVDFFFRIRKARPICFCKGNVSTNFQISRKLVTGLAHHAQRRPAACKRAAAAHM